MSDRERWEDLGCGDGGCVFRTPTGMHTNGGCRCLPRTAEYGPSERSRLRRWVMVMRDRIAAQEHELERLRQERYDALSVHTTEGLLASEWILRTGRAERELAEARRRITELESELRNALDFAHTVARKFLAARRGNIGGRVRFGLSDDRLVSLNELVEMLLNPDR